MEHFLFSIYIYIYIENNHPNWSALHDFSEGLKPPTSKHNCPEHFRLPCWPPALPARYLFLATGFPARCRGGACAKGAHCRDHVFGPWILQIYRSYHWGCKTRAIWISKKQPLAATRVAASGRKWPLGPGSHLQPLAATRVAASGRKWPLGVSRTSAGSHLQPLAATRRRLQPLAATCSHSSGRKWPQVAASGR